MTHEAIYTSSAMLDSEADALQEMADAARAKAKQQRWKGAPSWANCIVRPSKYALRALANYPSQPDNHPQHELDWRWALRDNMGWFMLDGEGKTSSAAEAGDWVIAERRND